MSETEEHPICRFYRLIDNAPAPRHADRSANGTLPVMAYQYCEPVAAASAYGWYIFPPLNFSLVWDGREIAWTREGVNDWSPVRAEPFPDFEDHFKERAPDHMADLMPAFLSQGHLPGFVQIWSGLLAETAPSWSLHTRGVANLAPTQPSEDIETILEPAEPVARDHEPPPYMVYQGIIDTDAGWMGPVTAQMRLMRTNSPVDFHVSRPMFQIAPVRREWYRKPRFAVLGHEALTQEQWQRFEQTTRRNTDHMRRPGHYAAETRRRSRRAS